MCVFVSVHHSVCTAAYIGTYIQGGDESKCTIIGYFNNSVCPT